MNIVLLILLIFIIIAIILVIKIPIEVIIAIDLYKRNGYMGIKIFFIKMLKLKLHLGKNLNIKKSIYVFPFIKYEKYKDKGTNFLFNLSKKMQVKNINIYVDGGVKENAFLSAMIISIIGSVVSNLFLSLKLSNKKINLEKSENTMFNENIFLVTSKANVKISLFESMVALIKTKKAG